MVTEFKDLWMETASGKKFFPLDPRPEDVDIIDISMSLSNQCRFGGQLESFYSVASHSIHVSRLVPIRFSLQALLHDAAEAYIVDLPTPLKNCLPQYREIEHAVLQAISMRFGQQSDWLTNLPEEIRRADKVALMTERRDLKVPSGLDWGINVEPHPKKIIPVSPVESRHAFIRRAQFLLNRL